MAGNPRNRRPRNTLLALLALVLALFGGIGAAHAWGNPKGELTPLLGLDLAGGRQIVIEPLTEGQQVQSEQLDQAIDIIRNRVDGSGVAEAEVSRLGSNIQVAIPGNPTTAQMDALSRSSQLRFRAVLVAAPVAPDQAQDPMEVPRELPLPDSMMTGELPGEDADPEGTDTEGTEPEGNEAPDGADDAETTNAAYPEGLLAQGAPQAQATEEPAQDEAEQTTGPEDVPVPEAPDSAEPTDGSDLAWVTPELEQEFLAFSCTDEDSQREAATASENAAMIACSVDGTEKYILGPAEVTGAQLTDASSGLQVGAGGQPTGIVEVRLQFDSEGGQAFREITTRLFGYGQGTTQNRFAIVLDGQVISAPTVNTPINDGSATISGNFTNESAEELANQLKFGALPMDFEILTNEQLSPTLGGEQLRLGMIAGAIGLLLIFIYSLIQYRALGLVTITSLLIAAAMAYGAVTLLGWANNFRLTMAGVTGLIVAIGMTADSFVVYFERIRDEVRSGRPLRYAVDTGWRRARRTIIISDFVNLLAATVLYFLSDSGVAAFAFALGLSTIIDLIVVMMFTHPLVSILANTKFFGNGHAWSGMDPERLGARRSTYLGRGQFATPAPKRTLPSREQTEGGIV